ncbi:MAG: endonuclease domain-containing protein [Bacteroidetes bacterium]|nr:MAG: endonuclease domain-containing protein [Bacteroidota bacterium]
MKDRRKALRKQSTPAEIVLWQGLRKRQLEGRRFRRQYSIGPYVVDFYCPEESLAIELDGSVHDDPARRDYDAQRSRYLERHGIRILRFENRRVMEQREMVLQAIAQCFHKS